MAKRSPDGDIPSRMPLAESGKVAMTPGITIGKYRVLKKLVAEGLWNAYLAEDTLLERKVLLQFPLPAAEDDKVVARFYQQAKLMAKLKHPNIVALHDVGEHKGRPFLAMDYVEGQNLEDLMMEGGSLPLLVLLRVMATVAGALQQAHDNHILHKDIKPRSVIVGTDGDPVLWNFALAAPASGDPLLEEGTFAGTPHYTSPEQARGLEISYQSDIWSLGATMFHVLAGRPPHDGKTPLEMMRQVVSPDPVDLSPLEGKAPEFVIDIVGKCLKKDPTERYQSADELRRALEAAVDYIETSQSDTIELAMPRKGQTILLYVEYQEAGLRGAFRPYEMGDRIAGGSYGDVYRAVEKLSGRTVALKILRHELVADTDAVTRFRREATLLSRLSHPNIVRVYNFGRYGATFFMSMDLLGDRTLADVIEEQSPMDAKEALSYLGPTLVGLSAMHETGIVHRDLKPENIAVTDDRIVVFDFGMAHSRDLKKLTMSGVFVGTPYYASPEQAAALTASGATDVYAAGVILYEMLTGKYPHEAETSYALLHKIVTEPPVPISERRPDLPVGMVEVLDRMLAKGPDERPSAAEARQLLAAATD